MIMVEIPRYRMLFYPVFYGTGPDKMAKLRQNTGQTSTSVPDTGFGYFIRSGPVPWATMVPTLLKIVTCSFLIIILAFAVQSQSIYISQNISH